MSIDARIYIGALCGCGPHAAGAFRTLSQRNGGADYISLPGSSPICDLF